MTACLLALYRLFNSLFGGNNLKLREVNTAISWRLNNESTDIYWL